MATIYLIRHGEPALTGVFLGQLDPPLSNIGKDQSRQLQTLEVEVAWSSTLRRARQTAAFLRTPCLIERDNLREISYGEWTGKTWAQIEAGWTQLAHLKTSDWLGISAPGGESWSAFLTRVSSVWQEIRQGPSPAAVVAHQGVNAALSMLITGSDPLQFSQSYAEVIRIESD